MTSNNIFPAAKYTIWVCDSRGIQLNTIDNFTTMAYSRALGSIGRFAITLPSTELLDKLVKVDNTIQIWREIKDSKNILDFVGFIRKWEIFEDKGRDYLLIRGLDGVSLLKSRIIAYAADSSYAAKTDLSDNMMKTIVKENLGASASDTTRRLNGYNFNVEPNHSQGSSITKKFAKRNVLDVLNDITAQSIDAGSPIYYDVVPIFNSSGFGWFFKTGRGYLGVDRSLTAKVPVVFSRDYNNLESPRLIYDYEDEITYVYVGGQGEGVFRELGTAEDTTRKEVSVWNRRELFVNYSTQESPTALTDRAKQEVQSRRPRVKFSGVLKDAPASKYGADWLFSDQVAISYRDFSFNGLINAISMSINSKGEERLQAKVEAIL